MTEQNQDGFVDVLLFMDTGAAQNWTSGHWKHKVTMHSFIPWLQAKAAELGREVSAEEIDTFVESTREEDLDVPMTAEEIDKRFRGRKSLKDIPATRLGDQWLYQQKLGGLPGKTHRRMQEEQIGLAKRLGRQITLAQIQNIFGKIAEELNLEASGPDTSVPEYKVGDSVPCTFQDCGIPAYPHRKTLTRNGRVVLHDEGPLQGLPRRVGNFAATVGKNGVVEVLCLCREHVKLAVQAGVITYPYEDAEKIAEAKNRPLRELEAMKKMAASSPAFAAKAKNKEVRGMVEGGRVGSKRKKCKDC